MFTVREISDAERKAQICGDVLRDLPNWFGIEEATQDYIDKSRSAPFFAAYNGDSPVGFIYLHVHNEHAVELYCMGVQERYHRVGIGSLLTAAAEEYCRLNAHKFLTVKTLADAHPDEGYRKTREFYYAKGFLPIEVFSDLWGEANPCLLMLKDLK
ncbi:MAG: GNAT family N-acetyltransferase [Oscillospiraceae bacterium]|jgi:GNAT superfamily N-acetyltransferase|nr:GNAT family N-acetyltransferase [Oscillospiraceae bacterium]